MVDSLRQLAAALAPQVSAKMRVAVVTGVQVSTAKEVRVTTDVTSTAWLPTNSDATFAVGDRVLLLQQASAWVVLLRLSGALPFSGPPVGTVITFAGASTPDGWLTCAGQSVSRTTFPELFAVLGTTYGSVDAATFTLPDLTARFPLGEGNARTRGATGGAETITLTEAQIPSHTHSYDRAGGSFKVNSDEAGNRSAADTNTGSTGAKGGGGAHSNMPPYLVLRYLIRAR